ncbi:hypothetical protein CRG98_021933 [Punica granatum]|uniref:Uncharacterized protein n=1 Tax=Punica granatum TaxID=22663 RepID=A0A2I0JMU7_PUNGR|nr:hypothetical protein CRG98_021933 [Punica granatum]
MACDLKGANKEPEAVECPEGKKQKRVVIVGLRSSLGLDKQKQEAVADTPKKRNKPSGTMFTGRSIQTHQLRKGTEEAISSEPESVARDVVSSPSKNKVTSFTCAGGCISDQEFKSTCANWRTSICTYFISVVFARISDLSLRDMHGIELICRFGGVHL